MSSLIGVKSHLSEPIKLRDGTAISEQDASDFRHLASNIALVLLSTDVFGFERTPSTPNCVQHSLI